MKAISIRQPFAWLVVNGIKDVENRTWETSHRGLILIHASMRKMNKAQWDALSEVCALAGVPVPQPSAIAYGAVIGAAHLEDIARSSRSEWWDRKSFAWVLSHAGGLTTPIPLLGKLGVFNADLDIEIEYP